MKKFFVAAGTIVCTVGIAGDECRNITASLQTYTYITCPGDNPNVTSSISETKRFSGTVACKFNGWRSTSDQKDITYSATGKCGNGAANSYGQCPPVVNEPSYSETSEGVTVTVTTVSKDLNQGTCIGAGNGTFGGILDVGTCDGTFCCGSEVMNACNQVGEWSSNCSCTLSPIIIDTEGDGIELTDGRSGVAFDLNADGRLDNIAWTKLHSDDGFLVLDRNHNGLIDDGSELFGSITPQDRIGNPNGFNALRRYDDNGDNAITRLDRAYGELRVWIDFNHSGRSEPEELWSLKRLWIESISLDYYESRMKDRYGNLFRYWSRIDSAERAKVKRAVDVFFMGAS